MTNSKQRWRFFLLLNVALLLGFIGGISGILSCPPVFKWAIYPLIIVGACLSFTLPTCVLYLIDGPLVMSLAPLIPSPESSAYRQVLLKRNALTDDQFYARFYDGSGIPFDTVTRLRHCLFVLDPLFDRIFPCDYFAILDDELDFATVLYLACQEFQIHFNPVDHDSVDGTFDNLVRLLHMKISPRTTGG